MDDMLSRNDLRDDEKAKRYFQLQNRYLAFKEQLNTRTRPDEIISRGVAMGGRGPDVPVTPPLVGLLLSKQPTIFRWRKCHDNILAVKAIVEKPTFLKFVFL